MATVSIDQGFLRGSKCVTEKGSEYFQFICVPYARPPVGDLRFKSPQLPEPWVGVRDATTENQSHVAPQVDLLKHHYIGTEDCLYLNIYTPKLPDNDKKLELLPVMLAIHGGGFLHGNGIIKSESGPDYLIDNDVVVVSINYRLGIFGFLSIDIPEAAGNMGLKDQVQALKWVQSNINTFGGDKNNVTIFGVSAGAASVEYLILSQKAEGLFHKAILQSGSSLNHWAINFEPQNLLHKLLQHLQFQNSLQDQQAVYQYLMTCPPEILAEESFKVIRESCPERLFFGFVPTIEKDFGNGEAFLTTNPFQLLSEGKFNKVPVIKGFCEMEGYLMKNIKPNALEELNNNKDFIRHVGTVDISDHEKYNKMFVKVYSKSLNNSDDKQDNKNIIDFFSDYDFISGIWLSGQCMFDHGIEVYLYKFSYDGKMNFLKKAFDIHDEGAAHADDITYIFKTEISNLGDESDKSVRDEVVKLWTNFAKSSNPERPVTVSGDFSTWPLFTRNSPKYLNIDTKFTIQSFEDTTKMEIFKEIYEKYQK